MEDLHSAGAVPGRGAVHEPVDEWFDRDEWGTASHRGKKQWYRARIGLVLLNKLENILIKVKSTFLAPRASKHPPPFSKLKKTLKSC